MFLNIKNNSLLPIETGVSTGVSAGASTGAFSGVSAGAAFCRLLTARGKLLHDIANLVD